MKNLTLITAVFTILLIGCNNKKIGIKITFAPYPSDDYIPGATITWEEDGKKQFSAVSTYGTTQIIVPEGTEIYVEYTKFGSSPKRERFVAVENNPEWVFP